MKLDDNQYGSEAKQSNSVNMHSLPEGASLSSSRNILLPYSRAITMPKVNNDFNQNSANDVSTRLFHRKK